MDDVAANLLPRASLLIRLLLREMPQREMSRTEVEVLASLRDGPRRITELADLGALAQPTMTLLVRRLEERGWVRRDGVPEDGRVVLVSITDAGDAALETFRARLTGAMRDRLAGLPDEELAALTRATAALGALVERLQGRIA